ncbi:MAG: hypothetical protein Q9227_002906 [Pyrenula ochraceoflavens]
MLMHCKGPVWDYDDLSVCFQSNYLHFLFPLLTSLASASILIIRLANFFRQSNHDRIYQQLPTEEPGGLEDDRMEDEEEDDEDLAELTLAKSVSQNKPSYASDVDKPTGEAALVAIELMAATGQVAINLYAWIRDAHGPNVLLGPIGGTLSWGYVLFLIALRFLSTSSKRISVSKLWYHTAVLYGFQWLFVVLSFRSIFVTPRPQAIHVTVIIEFSLATLLFLIALTTRKGNKPVTLEYEDNIEPAREPLASLISLASFSWVDQIVWNGFKKTLELSNVWNLMPKDKAARILADFRQVKKTHHLVVRLLLFFKKQLILQWFWAAFSNVFIFLPTLLLQYILEYVEDPHATPVSAAWLWVILLFASGVVQAIGDGQSLWIGRKICIRLRAIIIGEIYAKALRRKTAAGARKDEHNESETSRTTKDHSEDVKTQKSNQGESKKSLIDSQATNGTIINLMSIDSWKVADISSYMHFLWASAPVQLIIAIALLYRILGYSSLAGIGLMILVIPLNLWIAKAFQRYQQAIMAATDKRIHSTNEVLENIRIIKYFAWEERFQSTVNEKRVMELKMLRKRYVVWALAATFWSTVPIIITLVTFFIYTVIEKRQLVPSVAFPALSLFSLLRVPLDQLADMIAHVQESKVSIDRVDQFLNEEETEKYIQLRDSKRQNPGPPKIALQSATLTWSSKRGPGDESDSVAFRLIDMDVEFRLGALNIVAGPTGSGKSSLLMALLGEMKLVRGHVIMPDGQSRDKARPDPETGFTESIAFCAQQAWLVNDTIQGNILFASPMDKKRYTAVIHACALERDLEILDAGDQTLVGEKGIALSGGQKQRISLARAMYSNARHLLLDDCLSAVDSHTAKHIFYDGILGSLMNGRTCILVTHNVSLALPEAEYIVVLNNGKIAVQGHPDQVEAHGMVGEEISRSRPTSRGNSSAPSRTASRLVKPNGELAEQVASMIDGKSSAKDPPKEEKAADTRTEGRQAGRVKSDVMKMYLASMGSWYYWVFAGGFFVAAQLGSVATNVWIREWANAYSSATVNHAHAAVKFATSRKILQDGWGAGTFSTPETYSSPESTFRTPSTDVNVGYYLGVYALIAFAFLTVTFLREVFLFFGSITASRTLHQRLLHIVMHAKFKFFDSTPLGQLMNRFSKDIEAIDQMVAPIAISFMHSAFGCVTVVILIAIITPAFLIPGFFIAILYFLIGAFYIRSSVDLKRIESVQRSPLYQQLGETLNGMVTIRAYGDEGRFIRDNYSRINAHSRPFIYLWSTNRWLAFRVDMAGALVAFFAGVFVIRSVGVVDPGAAGLSLTYAITFSENILWLVRAYSQNEQNMNSVERVKEYIELEQEAPSRIPETAPPANWPSHGAVEFIGYTTRYRDDLDPVLKGVTFRVRPGEKVGIVGRTGAGKSSLTLALFRGLEAEEGKILVDDIDIGLIGLRDLREAITIVPQDPTLFSGTLRSNLDPFGLHSDEDLFAALCKVQLVSVDSSQGSSGLSTPIKSTAPTLYQPSSPEDSNGSSESSDATLARATTNSARENKNVFRDLSSPVSESGSNLSQGQRQLLCLARAILKAPRVLVMDEATASIDYATDTKIQETLRELKENTILTIAHRLQTIIDYDKVLVLDKGEVIEYDDPWTLLRKEGGSFRGMCETSGDFDKLQVLARKAWEERRLVDDS